MVNTIGNIGKIIVTKRLQKYIDYLHYKVGATEWSGVLFYKLTSGNIKEMKDLVFTADFLYPMDIGSATYTEFDFSGEVVNAYDINPDLMESAMGQIHTHHSMATFFSSTDQEELESNCKNYNFYVSLIVNFAHAYSAKIAFPSKTTVTKVATIKGTNGEFITVEIPSSEENILIGDLEPVIEGEENVDSWLDAVIVKLQEKKKEKEAFKPITNYNKYPSTSFGYGRAYTDLDDYDTPINSYSSSNYTKKGVTLPSSKVKKENLTLQFLTALTYLDSKKKDENIYLEFSELAQLTDDELIQFSGQLEENIEIIHVDIYDSLTNMADHCLEAILELRDYQNYLQFEFYEILRDNLLIYA